MINRILFFLLAGAIRSLDRMMHGTLLDHLIALRDADQVVDAALDGAQESVHRILDTAIEAAKSADLEKK
jgi:hypothetical protein